MNRLISVIIIIIAAIYLMPIGAYADGTGEEILGSWLLLEKSEADIQTLTDTFKIRISKTEGKGRNISSFDVSESGKIALCFDGGTHGEHISVYDSDGSFSYSVYYDFHGSSETFWIGEEAAVYVVRSDIAVTVNENGVTGAYVPVDSIDNHIVLGNLTNRKTITRGDTTYKLAYSSFGTGKPSKCVIERNGTEQILYEYKDAASDAFWELAGAALLIVFFVFVGKLSFEEQEDKISQRSKL